MNLKNMLIILSLIFSGFQTALAVDDAFYAIVEEARQQPSPITYAVSAQRIDVVKFLIDRNENIDQPTPDVNVYWDGGDWYVQMGLLPNKEPGYRPLEMAVKQNNVEMVRVLTTYHPTNRANPEYSLFRYASLSGTYKDGYETYNQLDRRLCSPLIGALESGNAEIVDLVLKAYKTPELHFNEFLRIKSHNNPLYMRSWMEHNIKLWNHSSATLPGCAIDHFQNHSFEEAVAQQDQASLFLFLLYGWMVTKEQFESVLQTKNLSIIKMVLKSGRFYSNFMPEEMLIAHHMESLIEPSYFLQMIPSIASLDRSDLLELIYSDMKKEDITQCATIAAEHSSIQVLTYLVSEGASMEGALIAAVQHHQTKAFDFLVQLPIGKSEIAQAIDLAYKLHYNDMLDVLLNMQ